METKIKYSWLDYWSIGLGLGLSRYAPGTMGSMLGVVCSLPIGYMSKNMGVCYLAVVTVFSCICCASTYKKLGNVDHRSIVCDEVVGMMWTFMLIPLTIKRVCIGFLLFRLLDIGKPGPIGYAEDKRLGFMGVMADDMVAGLVAFVILGLFF